MIDVTRGPLSMYSRVFDGKIGPNVIISDFPVKWTVSALASFYDTGIHAVVPSQRMIPADLLEPKIKNRSRMHYLMANLDVALVNEPNVWALLLDPDGFIAEGTGSNFFIVKDGKLFTPEPRNILRGTRRKYTIKLAREMGIEVSECNLNTYDAINADEAFFTSTAFTLMPCVKVQGNQLGDGIFELFRCEMSNFSDCVLLGGFRVNKLDEMTKLLERFEEITPCQERSKTFLEISGYPHRETVYSNILSFFFDSNENHGLDNLFLYSLLNLCGSEGGNELSVEVQTEVSTDNNSRLDIVIETTSHLIGIENKVFHYLDNPLNAYSEYLDKHSKSLDTVKIILCLSDDDIRHECQERLSGFRTVRYGDFFEEIQKQIGRYLGKANPKYMAMLLDFMETVENLTKGSTMSSDFLHFVQEKEKSIENFLAKLDNFKKELKQKVQVLKQNFDIKTDKSVKQWCYGPKNQLYEVLVHDITISDSNVIAIDTKIKISGWNIEFFSRKGVNFERLRRILDDLDIEVIEKGKLYEYAKTYDYEAEAKGDLAIDLQGIVRKLSSMTAG